MAYSIKGNVFLNDDRDLIDINEAGITTSLLVGPAGAETFTVDGVAGVVTAGDINGAAISATGDITAGANVLPATPGSGFVGRTTDRFLVVAAEAGNFLQADLGEVVISGVATVGSLKLDPAGVEVTDILDEDDMVSDSDTAIPTQQSVKKYVDDAVQGAVGGGGDFSGVNAELSGYISVGTTATIAGAARFDSSIQFGAAGQTVTSIATGTDLGAGSASDEALPTQLAVKSYVDEQFANGNTFDFQVEGGTEQNLDLTGDQIDFIGGSNLTASLAVSGSAGDETYALTFDLDSNVTIGDSLVVTNNFSFDGGQTVDAIETAVPASGSALDTALPTSKAVRDAIEAAASGGSSAAGTVDLQEDATTDADYVIPFASGTGGQQSLVTDQSQLYYNPSSGRLNAQEFNSLSDIRYKENIELIENPMAKVEALRGVTYDWKNNGAASAGIIAQEVQAVMPELISETEEKLTVNYNGLTGLLIEAIKELSAEVAALKAAQ